ncbi:MAG TPA: ATP-grasp domain-containing protein [Candidatus Paceibacterota bacterium]
MKTPNKPSGYKLESRDKKRHGQTVAYVTRDRERGEGMEETDNYFIIAGDGTRNTFDILSDSQTRKKIDKTNAKILVFKNTIQIERLAKEKGWELLNPSAELAEKIENKITQIKILGELAHLLPSHHVCLVKNIALERKSEMQIKNGLSKKQSDKKGLTENKPLIVQWAHSHTGDGTLLIYTEKELEDIKKKFPNREARVTKYIKGPMFTANILVTNDTETDKEILIGNISYQITGLTPFTDNIFSTIGNDWSIPQNILTEKLVKEFNKIAYLVGLKLKSYGWKGLFGIDVILNEEKDGLFLIEINARQPASATYESQLQQEMRKKGVPGITIFEAHIATLSGNQVNSPLIKIDDGAQIVQRITNKMTKKTRGNKTMKSQIDKLEIDVKNLEQASYKVIKYKNIKPNSDLLRIQSKRGIMRAHNKFNKRGKEISKLLENTIV